MNQFAVPQSRYRPENAHPRSPLIRSSAFSVDRRTPPSLCWGKKWLVVVARDQVLPKATRIQGGARTAAAFQ